MKTNLDCGGADGSQIRAETYQTETNLHVTATDIYQIKVEGDYPVATADQREAAA